MRARVAILALTAAAAGAAIFEVAGGPTSAPTATRPSLARDFDPATARPPWNRRCRIAIAGYEDGSASLYCGARRRSFARIDAESGRIRMRRPWRR